MALTNINLYVDEKQLQEFESFCKQEGINLKILLKEYIRYVNRNHKLPFMIEASEPREMADTTLDFAKYRTTKPYFANSTDIDQYCRSLRVESN